MHAGLVAEKAEIEERRKQAGVAAARREALKEKLDAARQSYIELLDIDAQTRRLPPPTGPERAVLALRPRPEGVIRS